MTEEKYRLSETIVKGLAVVGAIVSFFYGIHRYQIARQEEVTLEFWKAQLAMFQNITGTCGRIATLSDPEERRREEEKFWALYYGDGRMLLDAGVHKALSAFAHRLVMGDNSPNFSETKYAAFCVSEQCRLSLAKSWNTPLDTARSISAAQEVTNIQTSQAK